MVARLLVIPCEIVDACLISGPGLVEGPLLSALATSSIQWASPTPSRFAELAELAEPARFAELAHLAELAELG